MHNRRSWMMGLPNCVSSSGPAGGPGPGRCQRPGLQVTVTVTASGPGPDGFRSHVVAYTRQRSALRGTPEDKLLDAASYRDGSHWVPAPGPGIGRGQALRPPRATRPQV